MNKSTLVAAVLAAGLGTLMANTASAQPDTGNIRLQGAQVHTCTFSNAVDGALNVVSRTISTATRGSIDVDSSFAEAFQVTIPPGEMNVIQVPGPATALSSGGYPEAYVGGAQVLRPEYAVEQFDLVTASTTIEMDMTNGMFNDTIGTGDVIVGTTLTCSAK